MMSFKFTTLYTTSRKKKRPAFFSGRSRLGVFAHNPQTNSHVPLPKTPAFNSGGSAVLESLEPRLLLSGTPFVVNTLTDISDPNDTLLTLREAIEAANTNTAQGNIPAGTPAASGVDIITFASSLFTQGSATITLNGTELQITESLTITGPTAQSQTLTLNANQQSRVFQISGEATQVELSELTIAAGYSTRSGGGIHNDADMLTLINSSVSGNSAGNYGGGIYLDHSTLTLINSTVAGNSARYDGGGVHLYYSTLSMTNSTISGNSAERKGGGICNTNGTLAINNAIVALNNAPKNTDIDGIFSSNNSLVSVDPGFVRNPDPGNDNTWGNDDDIPGDLHLANTSLAINRGDTARAIDANATPLITDKDGNPRVVGEQVDIGAFEYHAAPSPSMETPSAVVTTLADMVDTADGMISLREAIVYGGFSAQIVTFAPALSGGTITLGGSELFVSHSLTIDATSIGGMTIDADGKSRVMTTASEDAEITLTDLTLTGGVSGDDGGGIYNNRTVLTLINSSVSGNSANSDGGGIYSSSPFQMLSLINSTVSSNSADNGGGIYNNYSGNMTLTNTTISDNSATGYGGGIYSNNNTLSLINSTVSSNSANNGGGIYGNNSTTTMINSTLSNNSANQSGGAINTNSYGSLTMINTTASGNSASLGGGIYNTNNTLSLTNSTLSGNSADRHGGGIFNSNGAMAISNTIVALNNAPNDTDIFGSFSNNNSLVSVDPGFVSNPTPGFDNTWGTSDDIPGNLHLANTSLAINRGDNALAIDDNALPLISDKDGAPRVADGQVDIGAFEYQGAPSPLMETPATVVTTLADNFNITDGIISLREAIVYGGFSGQIVTFAPALSGGTITLNGTELFVSQSLAIDATSIGGMTIDADGKSRVMTTVGNDVEITLTDLMLTGGVALREGGGIYNNHAALTLTNSSVSGNSANSYGGGIYNVKGTLSIANSIVSGNSANYGGGIDNVSGVVTMTQTTISGNSASNSGGGIRNFSGTLSLINSTISDNLASNYGAGIYNYTGTLALTNSTISDNAASNYGGGIYNYNSTLALINATVSTNAAKRGGGIYTTSGTLTVTNSTVSDNSADWDGGGIYTPNGTLSLTNSTISGNWADRNGGGIYNINSTLTLNNTIVALNNASNTTDIFGSFENNNSLVSVDPGFVRNPHPGPDSTWGNDDDIPGDFHLKLTSPAVNTGDNSLLPLDTTDLDNDGDTTETLPFDLGNTPRIHNNIIDMGAYENTQPLPILPGNFNGDESIDISDTDLLSLVINTNNQNPLFDLNNDNVVDLLDGQHHVINYLQANPADTNLDGYVNLADLITWAQNFGSPSPVFSQGDTNFDGYVNIADLIHWAQHFGQTTPPPAITVPLQPPLNSQTLNSGDIYSGDSGDSGGLNSGAWAHLKNLLAPTATANSNVDVIRNLSPAI